VRKDDGKVIAALGAESEDVWSSIDSADDSTVSIIGGLTPIPGLRVEVHEELNTTPMAVHEVITGQDGRPLSAVSVHKDSDVIIFSMDERIARFESSGPASEFAVPREPTIVATPMVDAVGVCRGVVAGTPIVQFFYNNMNEGGVDAEVPLTGRTPYLYRTPSVTSDDLLLNSIYQSSDEPIIPGANYLNTPPRDTEQVFNNGQHSFVVPFDADLGPLTWDFIGRRTTVTSDTRLCEEEAKPACQELSPEKIRSLVTNLRRTVTGVLKAAAKVMRVGSSPYLKTTSRAVREVKIRHKRLFGALVCPKNAALGAGCRREAFPFSEFMKLHSSIFKKRSPVKPQLFKKLRKAYNRAYKKFLYETFPDEIVFCRK
jgi:hypothetical protein